MTKKLIVGSLKGGVGKTTVAVNLACALADGAKTVVLVDLDAQGTATEWIEPGHLPITGQGLPLENTGGIPMLHGPNGVRVVYNTVGSAESLEVSVRIAGPRSTVVLSGVDTPRRVEWSPHYFKEINVVGSNAFGFEEWNGVHQHAMRHYFDLIRDKKIDATLIITHRFRLEEYKLAFEHTQDQDRSGAVKVLFDLS